MGPLEVRRGVTEAVAGSYHSLSPASRCAAAAAVVAAWLMLGNASAIQT